MENERKPFKDFGEFKDSDFDDATSVILAKKKALCKAIGVIKGFIEDMQARYSIIKDNDRITKYYFPDPTSIDLIVAIFDYKGAVNHESPKDRLDFANYLIKLGYDVKKKNKG